MHEQISRTRGGVQSLELNQTIFQKLAFDKSEIVGQKIHSDYSISDVRKNGSDLE